MWSYECGFFKLICLIRNRKYFDYELKSLIFLSKIIKYQINVIYSSSLILISRYPLFVLSHNHIPLSSPTSSNPKIMNKSIVSGILPSEWFCNPFRLFLLLILTQEEIHGSENEWESNPLWVLWNWVEKKEYKLRNQCKFRI